ncbi:major facilitator superfamily domain-containing protein [Xylariales sp. PMI_506]|nr:major facilitator superfamily domain-containing protein [Xylariales sp. PMI_506]
MSQSVQEGVIQEKASALTDPNTGVAEAASDKDSEPTMQTEVAVASTKKGWRFWAIFVALCVTSMLAAVESTVVSTALPSIVHDLDSGELYVWFVNAYFLTSTATLPLLGQLCNIFGRRWMMISVVALFALGSGISGGASSTGMMIAGRAIQGIGGGGINFLIELIVSDLLPLRERGAYMGIIFAVFSLGTSIGPFVGGAIVDRTSWRWVFYINLPISGVALILHVLYLRVNYDRETSVSERLKRIDFVGNTILIASVISTLIALSWAGTLYPWSSWHVLVPLVLGIVGLVVFHLYETMPWVTEPTLPERLFRRRTPAAALLLAFLSNILLFWVIYFLPVYFQAVLGMDPMISGVALLPLSLLSVLMAGVAGGILTKTGRYRPLHIIGCALSVLGLGLFCHFDADTSRAEWVLVQFVLAIGLGCLFSTILPAVQADLPDSDTASATAAFVFIRAYGSIWGVSVPSAIFNAKFDDASGIIGDASVEAVLSGGDAYSFATAALIGSFPEAVRGRVVEVYVQALRLSWEVSIGFALLMLLLCFLEKEIVLRVTLETEFGLETKEAKSEDLTESA